MGHIINPTRKWQIHHYVVGTQKHVARNHGGIIITFAKEKNNLYVVIVEPVYTSLKVCVCRTRERKASLLQTLCFALLS